MLTTCTEEVSILQPQICCRWYITITNLMHGLILKTIIQVWNDELAQVAQTWADQCRVDPLQHNPDRSSQSSSFNYVGENIGFSTNLNEPSTEIVRRWYDEVQDYTFGPVGGSNVCSAVCGHYTQVSAIVILFTIITLAGSSMVHHEVSHCQSCRLCGQIQNTWDVQ